MVDPGTQREAETPGQSDSGVDESLAALLPRLYEDLLILLRQELHLARVELGEKIRQAQFGLLALLCGGILALAALPLLSLALVFGLATAMPLWAAALLVSGLLFLAGGLLLLWGRDQLRARNLMPRRTLATLQAHRAQLMETLN